MSLKFLVLAAALLTSSCIDTRLRLEAKVIRATETSRTFTDANGDLDFGKTVEVIVQNRGQRSSFAVYATLSCSEGEWTKRRTVTLDHEETVAVNFDFPEPTLTAGNYQPSARIQFSED